MTKTRKSAPIAIGLACAAALLSAIAYLDLSPKSRATMEQRGRLESAADAIAVQLDQGLNVGFTFTRALATHIASQDFSQNATPVAVPRDDWRRASPVPTVFNILGVLMAGLVGLSVYFLARQLAKLRLTIDSATRELRNQKDELTIAQSRLVDAIERIPEGIALCDGAGDRVTANRRDDRSEPFETSPGRGEVERHERQPTEAKEQAEVAETPIVEGPGEAGEVVVPLPGPGAVRSEVRILIAEDNPSNQMVIKHFLEMSGYRPDVASNGLEALRAAEARAYDLVLMDISMPEMDGITAAAEIRNLARTWDTAPIIVAVTAHALPGDRKRFLAAGFDEVLVKPLHKRELLRGLSKWLSVAPPLPETTRGLD